MKSQLSACNRVHQLATHCVLERLKSLFSLPFSDNKFGGEILLPDKLCFFKPTFKTNIFYPAEIIHFHVMGVSGSIVSRGSQKGTGKIIAVTAQFHPLGFRAIQGCTPLWREMVMFAILLATPFAGNLIYRNTQFLMNQGGKIAGQIVLMDFTIKTIKPTRRG